MAAFEEPIEHALNMRDRGRPQAAGTEVAPWNDGAPEATLVHSDRFARLRAELAEAVAAAELTRVRKDCELARRECDTWRAIANERGRALERADFALQTLATVMTTLDTRSPQSVLPQEVAAMSRDLAAATRELAAASRAAAESRNAEPARAPAAPAPEPAPAPPTEVVVTPAPRDWSPVDAPVPEELTPADDEIVEIPAHVREEANRYAQTMQAMQEYKLDLVRPRHWWQFWR